MTPTFRVVGDQLQEQPRMKMPFINDIKYQHYSGNERFEDDKIYYELHVASMRKYTIRPSDWEGVTEVNEGEFEEWHEVFVRGNWQKCHPFVYDRYNDANRRLLAVPLRPAGKGQEEMWADVIDYLKKFAYMDQKDEIVIGNMGIKELQQRYTITLNKQ